jgi:ribonuclease III
MAVDGPLEPDVHSDQVKPDMARRAQLDISALEHAIGHAFHDKNMLHNAITHVSALSSEEGRRGSYQRLEFLGDRVLGLIVAHMLTATFPDEDEGELSRRLADLVRKESCADVASAWNVGSYLKLGGGFVTAGRRNRAILGDVCEAIIGAVHLDGGYDAARAVVEAAFAPRMNASARPVRDGKTALQEWAQGRGLPIPDYVLIERSGPDHSPTFRIAAAIAGLKSAEGVGTSKRIAEQAAAEAFLRREGVWNATHDN